MVEIAGLVLGIAALVLGIPALFLALAADSKLNRTRKALDSTLQGLSSVQQALDATLQGLSGVQQALSTKRLRDFPGYMPDVINLIRGAKKYVRIVCDPPAMSNFSDPSASAAYRHAIEAAILGDATPVEVSLICADEEHRRQNLKYQFGDDWAALTSNTKFMEKLERYRTLTKRTITDINSFRESLLSEERRLLSTMKLSEIKETSSQLATFFWCSEDEAIFAVVPSGDHPVLGKAYAFSTRDSAMIESFNAAWNRLSATAKPLLTTALPADKAAG